MLFNMGVLGLDLRIDSICEGFELFENEVRLRKLRCNHFQFSLHPVLRGTAAALEERKG